MIQTLARARARSRFLKKALQFREDGATRNHAPLLPSGDGILRRDNVVPLRLNSCSTSRPVAVTDLAGGPVVVVSVSWW